MYVMPGEIGQPHEGLLPQMMRVWKWARGETRFAESSPIPYGSVCFVGDGIKLGREEVVTRQRSALLWTGNEILMIIGENSGPCREMGLDARFVSGTRWQTCLTELEYDYEPRAA